MSLLINIASFLINKTIVSTARFRVGRFFINQVIGIAMENTLEVSHRGSRFTLPVPNSLCRFRATTFSTKEPETLDWIDSIPQGSILWDIGANIGLYSVYAAKTRKCKIFAFEPSVFNLELLARTIFLNKVVDMVSILPFALSDGLGMSELHMSTTEWGGAMSTFGQEYGYDGKKLKETFRFQTLGMTMFDAVDRIGIPLPDYIKIDVDGIEHLILGAGAEVLKQVKGVLVEINDDFTELADQCHTALSNAGLVLDRKLHSEMFDQSASYGHLYNQIWVRP